MRKKCVLFVAPLVALAMLFSALPTLAQENGDAEAVRPPALVIRAPRVAAPGEGITITVFDRATREPVVEAAVWAIPLDDPEALRAEITALEGASDTEWQAFLDGHGATFLDETNEDGQLDAAFTEEGRYLLVAFKPEYRPAFQPLLIGTPPKALGIEVANKIALNEEVTITVFDRATRESVEGAGVWAISRANSGRLRSGLAGLREYGNAVVTIEEFEALLSDAEHLGDTDQDGELTHTFEAPGRYFLVAFQPGSRAAFTPINVIPESGNYGRRPSLDSGPRPTSDNGRRPFNDNGRRPTIDGGWPTSDNGRRPTGDNGHRPTGDNGRRPTIDGGWPTSDNGRRPTGDSGRRPIGDNGRPQLRPAWPLPAPARR